MNCIFAHVTFKQVMAYLFISLGLYMSTNAQPKRDPKFFDYDEQLTWDRVAEAKSMHEHSLEQQFEEKGLSYPPEEIYLRALKFEEVLEVWVLNGSNFELFKEYEICRNSGHLGPKRQQGDRQVPEGFYFIEIFNPRSSYHLSLGINYPNESDSILGVKESLGGDIYIHGNCVTVGCLPLQDEPVSELYWLSVRTKANGQDKIPVHIFPARMDLINYEKLLVQNPDKSETIHFWSNLRKGYVYFEKFRMLPEIKVRPNGEYVIFPDYSRMQSSR